MKKNKEKKNTWLFKWDFSRYTFTDLDNEYKESGKSIEINFGKYYADTKENREKLETENPSTQITENDDIFIYFNNIPGASDQIYLKASKLCFKENGKYYYWKNDNKKSNHYGQLQRNIKAKKFEWVLDYNDRFRFTRDGLINNYNRNYETSIKDRPGVQKILNEKLITDLNNNLHSYSDMINEIKKIDNCTFTKLYGTPKSHELFTKKQNMPYVEQHHFVLKEKYYNYIKNHTKGNELLKSLVFSPNNIVLLCPRCHRQLHQGLESDVITMINLLLDSNLKLLDNTKQIAKILDVSFTDLISDMYNIKFKR